MQRGKYLVLLIDFGFSVMYTASDIKLDEDIHLIPFLRIWNTKMLFKKNARTI
jgi:hypothetical protein